jgi:hypothetical protein
MTFAVDYPFCCNRRIVPQSGPDDGEFNEQQSAKTLATQLNNYVLAPLALSVVADLVMLLNIGDLLGV